MDDIMRGLVKRQGKSVSAATTPKVKTRFSSPKKTSLVKAKESVKKSKGSQIVTNKMSRVTKERKSIENHHIEVKAAFEAAPLIRLNSIIKAQKTVGWVEDSSKHSEISESDLMSINHRGYRSRFHLFNR